MIPHQPRPNDAPRSTGPVGALLKRHPSVWLHGAGLAGDTWRAITADLPDAQTPDLPGHGSAPMVHPPRVEGYADALCDAVPHDAILIGHSLGGMVALDLAARMPDRIAALVLIEAVPTVRDRLSGRVAATIATALFSRMPPGWFATLSGIGQPQATQAELRRQIMRLNRGQIAAALDAARHYDGRSRLPVVRAPTLVVVGDRSSATLHGATLMAETIPNARLLKLPGGHMLHTDTPLRLRRAIDDFLRATLPEQSGQAAIAALPTSPPSSRPR